MTRPTNQRLATFPNTPSRTEEVERYLAEAHPTLVTLAQAVGVLQDARADWREERQPTPDGGGLRVSKRVAGNLRRAEEQVLLVAEALLVLGATRP